AMARNPADRYPDMAAFERALDAVPASKVSPESLQPPAIGVPTQALERARHESASDADIQAARPRLVLSLLAAVLLLVCAATVAISGIELASGYAFSKNELRLILLCIACSSFTPALLWFLHIKKKIWDNSSRVLALLGRVRAAVLAGIVSYGLLVLASHVIDDFLVRIVARSEVRPVGATWTGWNLLLPGVALVTAVAVAERRRLVSTLRPGWRRLFAVWSFTSLAVAIAAGLVYLGFIWRASR
ncbi:MAG TPA: hypothetical protein VIW29_11905, partial [Polyangiaceae bacterium]